MPLDSTQSSGSVPPMAIGSSVWPGLAKLSEECAEVQQIIGKLMAYPAGEHPDGAGPLAERLQDELADVLGAIDFTLIANPLLDKDAVCERSIVKRKRFLRWHDEERHRAA